MQHASHIIFSFRIYFFTYQIVLETKYPTITKLTLHALLKWCCWGTYFCGQGLWFVINYLIGFYENEKKNLSTEYDLINSFSIDVWRVNLVIVVSLLSKQATTHGKWRTSSFFWPLFFANGASFCYLCSQLLLQL